VRDEDVGEVELLLQLDEQVQHLRLDRDVECRDGLVGDDELRLEHERAREPDALALAAAELVRVPVCGLRRHADPLQHLVDDAVAVPARGGAVDAEALGDQVADLHAWVEGADGVLKDDLHVTAHLLEALRAQADDVDAVEGDLARRRLEQPQQRAAERRLAAAGLAHEAERLAAPHVEIDAVDGLQVAGGALEQALLDREVLLEAAHAEEDVLALDGWGAGRLARHRLLRAHDGTVIAWTSRGPFSHSQHAACCAPTSRSGGSSVAQRSKA
jgi:hypothetical protein